MKTLWIAFRYFLAMSVLTGALYPLLVRGVGATLFPHQAGGSLAIESGTVIGSELIGQRFRDQRFFWPRPSAVDYDPIPSGGSNLGPTSKALKENLERRRQALTAENPTMTDAPISADLLTSSASGLDPHISPESARYQADRVAAARGLSAEQREALARRIDQMTQDRAYGIWGEPRINVLQLNRAVEQEFSR